MKAGALFFSGLVLSALAAGPAAAEPVRVRVTARVMDFSDPNNVFAGKIVLGQRVNGTYVYNTNTPDDAPEPERGLYHPYANEARMRFVAGTVVFESQQPTQGIIIDSFASQGGGQGQFRMSSSDNKPLANGTQVYSIRMELIGTGNMTQSDALPNVAPDLINYPFTREVTISGNSFYLRAQLEIAELIIPEVVEVSPAAGSFVANQHFDAGLTLPRNSAVASVQATANGVSLPLSYPGGGCQLQTPNSVNKPTVVCPGADSVLPLAAGAPIEWTVTLTNGTVLTETVNWVRAP